MKQSALRTKDVTLIKVLLVSVEIVLEIQETGRDRKSESIRDTYFIHLYFENSLFNWVSTKLKKE